MAKLLILIHLAVLSLLPVSVNAQMFGQNKVNYNVFRWKFITTENFYIYYTNDGYDIALIASEIAEDAYKQLSSRWDYRLSKRIPIIIYNSHNEFTQTNVILEPLSEGVGGFTELFKNRIVMPWEGSLPKFRHVLHHELTHAVFFDMLYGGLMESVLGREYLFQLPLWFIEGIAEHESQYWSTEADMIVRDGIISGYLPPIERIYGGYLVYKGGESFFKFLQEVYGGDNKWIAGELMQSLRVTRNLERSFQSVFGKTISDLSEEWHRKLRADHWPEVAGRELAEDFGMKLTDHRELRNYLNANPAVNPTGDKIAFLTDRSGYKEIMLMSAMDGKLLGTVVKGEAAGDYEEIHWLRGGITWSPDGNMIAFAAKAGEKDAIHIRRVESQGYNRIIKPDMDAIYSPDWSPDGKKILFCGLKNGNLDLWTVDIETLEYTRLTDDIFDDANPRWSPDGKMIAFDSDRPYIPYELTVADLDRAYNVFVMNADGTSLRRISDGTAEARFPTWAPDSRSLCYVSDANGITNLYHHDLEDDSVMPLTNLLTGASSPFWSPDGAKIAFTSFKDGGWNIFLLKRPLERNLQIEDMTQTAYFKERSAEVKQARGKPIIRDYGAGDELLISYIEPQDYRLKFTPDLLIAAASYNTFFGLGGGGQVYLSDILGNHRIFLAGSLFYSIEESNLLLQYLNLTRRLNYGISAFNYKTYYRSYYDYSIFSDRIYGGSLEVSYPFSKFTRQDFSVNLLRIDRQHYDPYYYYYQVEDIEGVKAVTLNAELTNDTTLWGHTGPRIGRRYKLSVEHSPSSSLSDLSYTTVNMDYRKYNQLSNNFSFVTRFSGGTSFGEDPRLFFLGGIDNWLNARVAGIPSYLQNNRELFFARFPMPLRGHSYFENYGRRYFLTNFEFRFPFIEYLVIGWPARIGLGNIRGAFFTDIGSAWYRPDGLDSQGNIIYDKSFHGATTSRGHFELVDIKMAYGFGVRMNLGFAILRFDTAWKTNLNEVSKKPMFSFSIGPDF